jgi:hypothetical protein
VSGLSLSFMAFVLPPMLHMRLFWAKLDWVRRQAQSHHNRTLLSCDVCLSLRFQVLIGVDIFLILFGIVAAVTTTTVSAISIVGDYS